MYIEPTRIERYVIGMRSETSEGIVGSGKETMMGGIVSYRYRKGVVRMPLTGRWTELILFPEASLGEEKVKKMRE